MIKFLIEKEFKQILRNSFLPKMIFIFPCVMMLVLPWAANLEVKNVNLSIVDNDHSSYSQKLVQKISASNYFHTKDISGTYPEAMKSIESGDADIILEIEPGFERNLEKEGLAKVMISANAVNGTKGGLGSSYLSSIITEYASDIRKERAQLTELKSTAEIQIVSQNKFNPHLDYKVFMVPALMVQLLTIICGFLPALNIVGEKEKGTIEQLNVTPINKFTFIMAKLIPYWTIGFMVLTMCFGLARFVYGIIPEGSLITLYFFAALFILVISGFGLVISNHSNTMQQAMFVMFFFMIILILMSGLFTPVNSMPEWAQIITIFNPLKYFIQVMRMVYLKGSGILELTTQLFALLGFMVFFNSWAVISYRKNS